MVVVVGVVSLGNGQTSNSLVKKYSLRHKRDIGHFK